MRGDYDQIAKAGVEVLGISVDHIWSHKAFAQSLGDLPFPLLADWDKAVSRRYGVLNAERGAAQRSLFLIDQQGIVRWRNPQYDVRDAAQSEALMEAIAALPPIPAQPESA